MTNQTLSAERARELFDYNPLTGVLTWRSGRRAGLTTGTLDPSGYSKVWADGSTYWAHRLVWLIHYGANPKGDIDHINGNRSDNSALNLRDVSRTVNLQNQRRAHPRNATGTLGVSSQHGKYQARIGTTTGKTHLGTFDTPEDAHQAYLSAKRALHAGCTL